MDECGGRCRGSGTQEPPRRVTATPPWRASGAARRDRAQRRPAENVRASPDGLRSAGAAAGGGGGGRAHARASMSGRASSKSASASRRAVSAARAAGSPHRGRVVEIHAQLHVSKSASSSTVARCSVRNVRTRRRRVVAPRAVGGVSPPRPRAASARALTARARRRQPARAQRGGARPRRPSGAAARARRPRRARRDPGGPRRARRVRRGRGAAAARRAKPAPAPREPPRPPWLARAATRPPPPPSTTVRALSMTVRRWWRAALEDLGARAAVEAREFRRCARARQLVVGAEARHGGARGGTAAAAPGAARKRSCSSNGSASRPSWAARRRRRDRDARACGEPQRPPVQRKRLASTRTLAAAAAEGVARSRARDQRHAARGGGRAARTAAAPLTKGNAAARAGRHDRASPARAGLAARRRDRPPRLDEIAQRGGVWLAEGRGPSPRRSLVGDVGDALGRGWCVSGGGVGRPLHAEAARPMQRV